MQLQISYNNVHTYLLSLLFSLPAGLQSSYLENMGWWTREIPDFSEKYINSFQMS